MSVPVELEELRDRLAAYGAVGLLITVGDDGRPHVVSVAVSIDERELVAGAGRTTSTNIGANPAVSIVWAAPPGSDYCLIVDGSARVQDDRVRVTPGRAVLHRIAGAPGEGPSCITVLSR